MEFDRTILNSLLDDVGEESAELIFDALSEELSQQADELLEASQGADVGAIRQVAHKLKNTAATLGFITYSQICTATEHAARDGNLDAAMEAMQDFSSQTEASKEQLVQLKAELF